MVAPWIAEAERAAAEASESHWVTDYGNEGIDRCVCGALVEDWTDHRASVAVAAVVPILAEHFAQAVEAVEVRRYITGIGSIPLDPQYVRDAAARVIREAATPTEGAS